MPDLLGTELAYGLASIRGGSAALIDALEAQRDELARITDGELRLYPGAATAVSLLLHSPAGPALDRRIALSWIDATRRAIAACPAVDAGTPDAMRRATSGVPRLWFDPFGPGTSVLGPRLAEALLARRARFAITLAGLDALAWRRAHGEWPDACGGTDPFTDGPLGYERTGDGVRISVAAERSDDPAWALPG